MPQISVIIPAFDAADWIAATIQSVLDQTWRDLEVLVVNDGSRDQTAAVAKGIPDARVRILSQDNRGASAARNHGFACARGDFIQYLDADDLLGEEKLEAQLEALAHAGQGAIASCAWAKFSDDPSAAVVRQQAVWEVKDPLKWLVDSLCGGGMMQPGAWLVPRNLIEQAGPWDESLSLHDDGEFFTRVLLQARRNVFVPGPMVYYREVAGSLSRTTGRQAMQSALAVCRSRHRHLLAAADTAEVRRAIATQYGQFAYEYAGDAEDLCFEAMNSLRALGVAPAPCIGGASFRRLAQVLGFAGAWQIRKLAMGLRTRI